VLRNILLKIKNYNVNPNRPSWTNLFRPWIYKHSLI